MNHFENRTARRDQEGFTLLEMLVTVGIMAAVAGTATLALQDTTARASAAAHVAHMDELNEGIMTFRVLRGNAYPNNWDSLMGSDDATDLSTNAPGLVSALGGDNAGNNIVEAEGDLGLFTLDADMVDNLAAVGITNLRVLNAAGDPPDAGDCGDIQGLVNSRGNAVVAGNLFLSPDANGCGAQMGLADAASASATNQVLVWTGGQERVLGGAAVGAEFADPADATAAGNDIGAKVLMAVGTGPSSELFDASELGGMTSVPVYRHVAQDQYNRYIALFHIANIEDVGGTATFVAADQVNLVGIVDGAGDTKEEELGEWDGTRNTI